eukprot:937259-Alexandrium_andersonii.AAC.1
MHPPAFKQSKQSRVIICLPRGLHPPRPPEKRLRRAHWPGSLADSAFAQDIGVERTPQELRGKVVEP